MDREKTMFDVEVENIIKRYLQNNGWKLLPTAKALGITPSTCRKLARRGNFWPRKTIRA